jgi:hypothetical protein
MADQPPADWQEIRLLQCPLCGSALDNEEDDTGGYMLGSSFGGLKFSMTNVALSKDPSVGSRGMSCCYVPP